MKFIIIILGALSLISCKPDGNTSEQLLPEMVSYNFHIRPILSDKCFVCHGPDANKRQAGLRLDIADSAYKALEENPALHAVVPGFPDASAVYQRISATDSSLLMPPVDSNLKLSEFDVSMIKKWIKQGAKYEPHCLVLPILWTTFWSFLVKNN